MKTPEEAIQELKDLGVDLGSWGITPGGKVEIGKLTQQRAGLERLRNVLGEVVERDQQSVQLLYEQLSRLEHGGGS